MRASDREEVRRHGEVEAWSVPLTADPEQVNAALRSLSPVERERADSFRFARHRRRFIVAHHALRVILSRRLHADARELVFVTGSHGKPALETGGLHFNLSRSGELALVVATRAAEIGVDIERVRPLDDLDQLAERVLSPREAITLRALPERDRLHAFHRCWTRKEAVVKALGEGLSRSTQSFDVTFVEGEPARLLAFADQPGEAEHWSLEALDVGRDHAAAIAIRHAPVHLVRHEFPGPDTASRT